MASRRAAAASTARPSSLIDTRVIYCGDNLDQLRTLPAACIDLIYIDPPFNSNRDYEVFWGETKEKRAFEDRHASTAFADWYHHAPQFVLMVGTLPPEAPTKCWRTLAMQFCVRVASLGHLTVKLAIR